MALTAKRKKKNSESNGLLCSINCYLLSDLLLQKQLMWKHKQDEH